MLRLAVVEDMKDNSVINFVWTVKQNCSYKKICLRF